MTDSEGFNITPPWEERGFKVLDEQLDDLKQFAANPKQRIPTGLPALDHLILGPAHGELFTFIGRSYTGKSLVATNIMANNATSGILFFSLEMPSHQVYQRLWAHVSGLNMSDVHAMVQRNSLPNSIKADLVDYRKHVVVDKGGMSIGDFSRHVQAYEAYFGDKPNLVLVDYLELVAGGKQAAEGWQRTEANAAALKDWAKNMGVGVVAVHQTNKTEHPWDPPTENSARGGGFTESDVVVGIWRPARDPDLDPYTKRAQEYDLYMNVLKNRVNGRTTIEPLKYRIDESLNLADLNRGV